jgi:hypothetical protein
MVGHGKRRSDLGAGLAHHLDLLGAVAGELVEGHHRCLTKSADALDVFE